MLKKQMNQRGFGQVMVILVVAIVAAAAYAGYNIYQANQDSEPVATDTATPSEPEAEEVVDPTADWESYTSRAGKYKLKHPAGWFEDTCDESPDDLTLYLGPTEATRVLCGSEHGSQIMFVSTSAVPTESEQELDSEYYSERTSEVVEVDGVTGERTSGKLKTDEFGVPQNTLVVRYFFLTPGRSYIASYIQAPSGDYAIDNLDNFELIVKQTWDFTN